MAAGERLKALAPDVPDPDQLISSALALRQLTAVGETEPGYKDTAQLTDRARREVTLAAPVSSHLVKLATIRSPKDVNAVAFSSDGRHLALACYGRQALIVDVTGRHQLRVRPGGRLVPTHVSGVAFDPPGGRLATASSDCTARIWDARTGTQLLKVTHTRFVRGAVFSPDGRMLVTASGDHTAQVWHLVEEPAADTGSLRTGIFVTEATLR